MLPERGLSLGLEQTLSMNQRQSERGGQDGGRRGKRWRESEAGLAWLLRSWRKGRQKQTNQKSISLDSCRRTRWIQEGINSVLYYYYFLLSLLQAGRRAEERLWSILAETLGDWKRVRKGVAGGVTL